MAGQRAQIAGWSEAFGQAADLIRSDRRPADVGVAPQQGDDLGLAFLRLERAGAIDDGSARPRQGDRLVKELTLQPEETGKIGRALEPGDVRMTANGAGRRAGRVDQRRRRTAAPSKARASATTMSACSFSRSKLAASIFSRSADRSTVVTAAPAAASSALLPPGAAQRSTTRCPGSRAEKPRRKRCGGVLHPPFALRIAFELGDREMRIEAHRACRENDAAEPLRPACGIALDAEVERRLAAVRGGDRARRFVAVSRAPARREPMRRVVVERVRGGEDSRAIARDCRAGRR